MREKEIRMCSSGGGHCTVTGVVLGGSAVGGGSAAAGPLGAADVVSTLPFTGAGQTMLLLAIALVLLVAGALAVGLARHRGHGAELT
jgi:hypothetical protein